MRLGDDGEALALLVAEPLDEPHLPERLVAVESLGEEAPGEPLQLFLATRGGQGGVPHVVLEIELRLVDPDGPSLPEGHENDPLPVARNLVEARVDEGEQVAVRRRLALELGNRSDVHVGGAVLELEKEGVEGAQALGPLLHATHSVMPAPQRRRESGGRSCARTRFPPSTAVRWPTRSP